jgi:dienelactone hydrolase
MKKTVLALSALLGLTMSLTSAVADGVTRYGQVQTPSGQTLPYAVHLPPDYDSEQAYPVLVGPGDGEEASDPGFYWQTDPNIPGWIIVDAQLWESDTASNIDWVLDAVLDAHKVEGDKFHAVCWSANSAGIFRLITANADRFHSITGMAGNPAGVSGSDLEALQSVKVQFVVGENDTYWQRSARDAHEKLVAGGVNSVFEIVPNGEHVMKNLIGEPFIQKLEKLR